MQIKMVKIVRLKKIKQEDFVLLIISVLLAISVAVLYISHSTMLSSVIALGATTMGILASMRYRKVAIVMAVTLALDYFGLVPFLTIGSGTLHWYDFNVILGLALMPKYLHKPKKIRLSCVIWIFFVFIIIGCIQSYKLYGQSILTTLLTARQYFSIILFWPLYVFISNETGLEQFKKCFIKVCKLAVFMYFLQWGLENMGFDVTFLQTKVRWGIRLYINISVMLLFYFVNLFSLIYERSKKDSFINCVMCVMALAIIAQARSVLFYMAIVTIILLLISKKPKTIIKYSLAGIVALGMLFIIPTTRNIIISSALESNSNANGSIAYRILERTYYTQQLAGHEWIGVGIPNTHSEDAIYFSGMYSDWSVGKGLYYLSDLGAFKIWYQFGIIAYVLYFTLLVYGIVKTYKRRTNWYSFAVLAFFAFLLIDNGLLEFFTREPAIFAIVLSLLEYNNRKNRLFNFTATQKGQTL